MSEAFWLYISDHEYSMITNILLVWSAITTLPSGPHLTPRDYEPIPNRNDCQQRLRSDLKTQNTPDNIELPLAQPHPDNPLIPHSIGSLQRLCIILIEEKNNKK